jgi:NADH-quinone oxidoreductase subunit J
LVSQTIGSSAGPSPIVDNSNLTQLSQVLFHELLLPFEVTSVLILIAILGAVALARAGHGEGTAAK